MPDVLIVDDDEAILNSLKRLLRKEDYNLHTANSGEEGLRLAEKFQFSLVITDQKMPNMEGLEFLKLFKKKSPDTVRVILSGYVDPALVVESINQGEILRFFGKPWNDDELKAGIRQCLEHFQLQAENKRLLDQIQQQNEMLLSMNVQLEQLVETRTYTLTLAQEIVDELPVSVVCFDNCCNLMICNDAAQQTLAPGETFALGSDCTEYFTQSLQQCLERCMKKSEKKILKDKILKSSPNEFSCLMHPLSGDPCRGVLVIIEKVNVDFKADALAKFKK